MLLTATTALADYTVASGTEINASSITGESGVLTINGRLLLTGDVTLTNFTTVIINGDGNIYWNGNHTLTFPNVDIFNIVNPTTSGGLQPTAGNGTAATRLYIGTILIAVSSDNSQNAAYSFEQFTAAGGLPIFSIAASVASPTCSSNPFTVTITPQTNITSFQCEWIINGVGSGRGAAFTTPQSIPITPNSAGTSVQTFNVVCNLYRANDNDLIATKSLTVIVNPKPTITSSSLSVCRGSTTTLTGSGSPNLTSPWISSSTTVATISNTGIVTGVSAGTSQITYTNSNGCSQVVTITVLELPVISGNLNICIGSSTTLSGTSTAHLSSPWISSLPGVATVNNSGVVTGVAPGTSIITYKNSNGCEATTTVTVSDAYVWTGAGGNNLWSNSSNWTNCGIPGNNANVVIPQVDAGKFFPKLDVDFISGNLEILGNSTIDLDGHTLTLGTSGTSVIKNEGSIIGSNSSSLVIKGTLTQSLKFVQTTPGASNALLNFTMNACGKTVTLANSIWIWGNMNPLAGILASNGFLTMVSTATSTSNITAISGCADISGDVVVQSYFTGGDLSYRRYRFVSSPIDDTKANLLDRKTYDQLKSFMFITSPNGGAGFDLGSTTATIQTYDETLHPSLYSYFGIPSLTTLNARGRGFTLFYRGNRTDPVGSAFKLKAPNAVPESQVISYQGPINKNDITVSNLTYTPYADYIYPAGNIVSDGLNLVGNPYPSTIDFNLINAADRLNINQTVYISRHNSTGFTGIVMGVPFNDGTSLIQPGQAFFIQATANNASMTFRESIKYSGSLKPMRILSMPKNDLLAGGKIADFPNRIAVYQDDLPQVLRINLQDELNIDETLITFKSGNQTGYRVTEDASYMGGSSVSLTSLSKEGNPLLFNGMPGISELHEIKLNVNASATKTVKLNFTDLAAVGNYQIFLKDNYLNKVTDVRARPTYAFEINKGIPETYGLNRFVLLFQPPKNVELTSFTAKVNGGTELQWVTAHEASTDYFEVERSIDGKSFQKIGSVKGGRKSTGSSAYSYLDKTPLSGPNYYRLKQVDIKGDFTYSEKIFLTNSDQKFGQHMSSTIFVFPNPAVNFIRVEVSNRLEPLKLSVINTQGISLKNKVFGVKDILELDVSELRPDIYIVEVLSTYTNKKIGEFKIIKKE